jgi:glycosyltransferase involved in cell wall biosynthesis
MRHDPNAGARPMRIAIAGTRGIPANYGGFETFAEELSTRLAARGHDVAVYCRSRYPDELYRGVRLIYLPAIRHKYFETLAHAFISTLHLLAHPVDAALYCNGANAVFTIFPRIFGRPVALNVDGIERTRKKWNRLAKVWYLASEYLATFCPTVVVTDARTIRDYYRERYGKESVFIPYGAETGRIPGAETLAGLGLEPGRYFLYVSRLEPENRALEVREAFEKTNTAMKLALVGNAPYAREYIRRVLDTRDERIVIPGAIYGQGYRELGSHCFAYIHATEVGGTHPALIEAMGRGALVLYRNTPENQEVAGGVGIPFEPEELTSKMEQALAMPEEERAALREKAMARVRERYSWDAVTDAYERLLRQIAEPRSEPRT